MAHSPLKNVFSLHISMQNFLNWDTTYSTIAHFPFISPFSVVKILHWMFYLLFIIITRKFVPRLFRQRARLGRGRLYGNLHELKYWWRTHTYKILYCLVIITSWFKESCAVFPFQLHWMLDLFLSSHKLLLCLCLNVKPFLSANITTSFDCTWLTESDEFLKFCEK